MNKTERKWIFQVFEAAGDVLGEDRGRLHVLTEKYYTYPNQRARANERLICFEFALACGHCELYPPRVARGRKWMAAMPFGLSPATGHLSTQTVGTFDSATEALEYLLIASIKAS